MGALGNQHNYLLIFNYQLSFITFCVLFHDLLDFYLYFIFSLKNLEGQT